MPESLARPRLKRRPRKARGSSETRAADWVLSPPSWFAAVLIVTCGLAAFANSFEGVFVFDDEPAIAQNPNLKTLWPLTTAMSAPADTTLSGRPVATLSFALDHAFSGGSLWGLHATNLAIHLLASLLVFGITRLTLLAPPLQESFGSAASRLALIVGLLFVVHPLQTSSVTYIVQRVESLMGVFYLLTLYASIRSLGAGDVGRRIWMSLSIGSCALGMATKEVMVTAPLMVMLWDRQFATDRPRSRASFHLGLAATWVILAALVTGGHRSASVGFAFPDWPWWRYFLTQAEVICHYLRLSLVPWPLVLDYDWRAPSSWVQVAFPCLFVAALVMMTVWGVARRVPASFAGAWFLLILAPTSSVLPIVTEVAVEHRMYLPLASVLALGVMGGYLLATRPPAPVSARWRRSGPAVGVVMAAIATLALGWLTYRRNDDYHNYDRIWADTIAKRPHNARARNNYATSLLAQGRFAEAEPHLLVAIGENPVFVEALANLGVSLSAQGRVDAGIPWLERAIALRPGFASAHRNLGEAFALQHRLGAAASEYVRSLALAPDDVSALNRAAWILATAGDEVRDGARARGFAERAVRLTRGEDAASLDSLGAALAEVGEFEAAIAAANQALLLARSASDEALSNDLRRRLNAYAQRKAFREP